jgi:hypothetical protein
MFAKIATVFCVALILGNGSAAVAKSRTHPRGGDMVERSRYAPPASPYGSNAQLEACIRNVQASGRSPLGPRGTAAYIQDRGVLELNRITEEDLILWRCMRGLNREYVRRGGR